MPVQMELSRIIISEINDQQVIYLKEVDGDRQFPILIGIFEATSIDRRVKGYPSPRPLTHDLLVSVADNLGGEFQANSYTSTNQYRAVVAAEADGDFVVVWQSGGGMNPQDGSLRGIFGQRFSSAVARQAAEFQVNQYTPYHQRSPEIAADASGDYIVTWESNDDGALRSTSHVVPPSWVTNSIEVV